MGRIDDMLAKRQSLEDDVRDLTTRLMMVRNEIRRLDEKLVEALVEARQFHLLKVDVVMLKKQLKREV